MIEFIIFRFVLRNWQFQVFKDGINWVIFKIYKDDISLNEFGFTAIWFLIFFEDEKQGWRYIKIQQIGRNVSGQIYYLFVLGMEIYGIVNGVCDDLGEEFKFGV